MIQIFKKTPEELKQVHDYNPGTWINISAPATSEIEEVSRELGIPIGLLSDPLDIDERARIEIEDDFLLILIRVPIYDEEAEVPYRAIPLGIIYSGTHVITVASRRLDVLQDFIQGKVKNFNFDSRERFIFQIFFRVAVNFLNFLKEINNRSNAIETKLHRAVNNKQLISLLLLMLARDWMFPLMD
jgi:magnesium transporter